MIYTQFNSIQFNSIQFNFNFIRMGLHIYTKTKIKTNKYQIRLLIMLQS